MLGIKLRCAVVVLLAGLASESGCQRSPVSPLLAAHDSLATALAAAKSAEGVQLYQGLPHPGFNTEIFEKAKTAYGTKTICKNTFYAMPHEMAARDVAIIIDDLMSPHALTPMVPKACGGFHADYAIQWTVDGETYRALICFGCGEIIIGGSGQKLHADLNSSQQLYDALMAYPRVEPPQ